MISNLLGDATVAQTAIQELQNQAYPRFADVMTKYGYDWEPVNVTTEDNFILTTFHVLGKTGE